MYFDEELIEYVKRVVINFFAIIMLIFLFEICIQDFCKVNIFSLFHQNNKLYHPLPYLRIFKILMF